MKLKLIQLMVSGLMMTTTINAQITEPTSTEESNAPKEIRTETVVLSNMRFTGIKASSTATLFLVQADSNKVTISPPDFNIKNLNLTVKNGLLNVSANGLGEKVKIYIYSPEFNTIEVSGATDVKTDGQISGQKLQIKNSGASDVVADLNYRQVQIHSTGASDVFLKGIADTLEVEMSGASDLKAFELKNTHAYVQASGASDVQLNTDSTLIANLSGASSIKFQKEPAHKNINSGDVAIETEPKTVWVETEDNEFSVEEGDDTTKIKLNGNEIIVIEKDGETKVLKRKIEQTENKKKDKFKGNWVGLELGVNGYLSPNFNLDMPTEYEFMELNYPKSLNFNINFFQQSVPLIGNKIGLVTGMGLQWNNYNFYNASTTLNTDSGKITGYYNETTGRSYIKSKLTSSYLVVPLLLEFQTNRNHETNSFHLSAGVIGGVRLSSHTKQVYSFDGSGKNKPKTWDEFYLQPFKLDATVRIGWGPLNLYGNYSVFEMFRQDRGPELYPFSIGAIMPFS